MRRLRVFSLRWILTAIVGFYGVAPLAAAEAPPLLLDAAPVPAALASAHARSEISGRIDLAALAGARFALTLPDGARIVARRERVERRDDDDWSWFGRVEGEGGGQVRLAVRRGSVAGVAYGERAVYEIAPEGSGRHRVSELDFATFAACAGAIAPTTTAVEAVREAPLADPFDEIDVLVLFTPQALAAAGGLAEVRAVAQAAVDAANTAWTNSQVVPRMHLVHSGAVAHADDGSMGNDLSWLANDASVAWLRDAVGADMVSLLVAGGGACGIGYVQRNPGPGFASSAFQVTALGCAVGNLSFAHEFGHNQGCEHNPENSSAWPNSGSYPWSFGHWYSANYRTVMSYSNPCTGGCTRHPYFSNSNVEFQGEPTGILDERENYRTLNSTAQFVSNFRLHVDLVFVDDFESGGTVDWN